MDYPLKHISIRVPWHDTGWDGRVCAAPRLNGACLRLKHIAETRNDDAEESVAGTSIQSLPQDKWPPCIVERAAFMAPFEYVREAEHPHASGADETFRHFRPTPLRHPPYSAPAIPYAWVLRKALGELGEEHELDVQDEREPNLSFNTSWIQERENQTALLDCFANHLKPERSLCFFYAQQVPFVEASSRDRILIGVGRVLHVGPAQEYDYTTKNLEGKLRGMLWERMVQHSIRPDFKDGFLLPYHAAIEKAEEDSEFDPAEIAAFAPADRLREFSYGSELVSHDGAIASLLACSDSLHKVQHHLRGPWDRHQKWIDDRLGELWKARGPCPGLASALTAFGLERGTFIARILAEKAGENGDPWPLVNQMFAKPKEHLPEPLAASVGKTLRKKWSQLPGKRRALLKLVSRFEIGPEQATKLYVREERENARIDISDTELLANPYLFYELTRLTASPVSIWDIDRGVFPDETVRKKHPLPEPTALDAGTDARRVRALTVSVLEDAARDGSTLLPRDNVVDAIRQLNIRPGCPIDGDLMDVAKDDFESVIEEFSMVDNAPALQLGRLKEMGETIRKAIEKRTRGARLTVDTDWRERLDERLSEQQPDEEEERAREEKTAALKELAAARISVLIGPAGTGKTTLLSVLCSHPKIRDGGILLLAPTGKARVRMEEAARDLNLKGYTIAQFLSPHRYDGVTGRYRLSHRLADSGARTVIIDEASMLTEEMLGALIQALRGVRRVILIGDPRQLPPIGAGRPFVDIVKRLAPEDVTGKFPRVGPGYAELTVHRRQKGQVRRGEEREDLRLAEWFSGSPIAPGEDDIFDKVMGAEGLRNIRFVQWDTADEMRSRLIEVLVNELGLNDEDDVAGFNDTLGGEPWNEIYFFNPRRGEKIGAAEKAEGWQIISPVRSGAHGVPDLNRLVHKQFRQTMIEAARKEGRRKYPKPMGHEEIVYGDKVINLINTDPNLPANTHRRVYPSKDSAYIANGEIGMACGFFWKRGLSDMRYKLEVEFSSQPGYKYDFIARDFEKEGNAVLELAYALTVHKSQGSQFGTVILVLPNPCRLLSRELLYTALTRQQRRVVILHQGPRSELRKYSSDDHSETARRLTNLFRAPSHVEINGRVFENYLIHRTTRGEMVRSKSEVTIANLLHSNGIEYAYEQPLKFGSMTKYPDFTIEDEEAGQTFYWEHCGMLHVPDYRRRWDEKLDWYRSHCIAPWDEGGGRDGTLIVSRDEANGSIDSAKINSLISELFG